MDTQHSTYDIIPPVILRWRSAVACWRGRVSAGRRAAGGRAPPVSVTGDDDHASSFVSQFITERLAERELRDLGQVEQPGFIECIGAGTLDFGKPQKIREFNLTDPTVAKLMKQRYGDSVPMDEPAISPVSMFDSPLLTQVAVH